MALLEMAVGGIVGYLIGKSQQRALSNPLKGRGYDIAAPGPRGRVVRDYAPTLAMAEGKARRMKRKYGAVEVRRR